MGQNVSLINFYAATEKLGFQQQLIDGRNNSIITLYS